MLAEIPNPWREFLRDVDDMLAQHATAGSIVELHCVGGFVIAMCYLLARQTVDLDVFEVVPPGALAPLISAAGKDSSLAKKHGVYIDAGSRVATLPESYAVRLTEIFPGTFVNLKLLVLDRYDLALSKLERNIDRDREDVQLLHERGSTIHHWPSQPPRSDVGPLGRDDRGDSLGQQLHGRSTPQGPGSSRPRAGNATPSGGAALVPAGTSRHAYFATAR